MLGNLETCGKCGISLIQEERDSHFCLFEVKYVGYILVNGRWLIHMISKDGLEWVHLETALPILPTKVERLNQKNQPTKDDSRTKRISNI